MQASYAIGDVHGEYDRLTALLTGSGLVDNHLHWQGENATLVFMGDFFDRGPDGIGCLDLIRQLQLQARRASGEVHALLGNHEILTVSAFRFNRRLTNGPGGTFVDDWLYNGGQITDLRRLSEAHLDWLANLPAMLLVQAHLLIHADAMFYLRYGSRIEEVNEAFRAGMFSQRTAFFNQALQDFTERYAFLDEEQGSAHSLVMLKQFGGKRIVHGHTPIAKALGKPGSEIRSPLVYAGGLVVNVDGGLYMGGDGFVYRLEN